MKHCLFEKRITFDATVKGKRSTITADIELSDRATLRVVLKAAKNASGRSHIYPLHARIVSIAPILDSPGAPNEKTL